MTQTSGEEFMTFDAIKTRVMHMASEMCGDERCAVLSQLDQCVDKAVASRWTSPVKSFVPLFAYREVRQCIEQGFCPDLATDTTE
jgi:hypothetical protein